MKHIVATLLIPFLLISCDFSTITFDVKKVEDIPGHICTLTNNTPLKVISFSGFDSERKDIWTQTIAQDTITGDTIRIITPQFYKTKIVQYMTYHHIDFDEVKALSLIGKTDLKIDSDNLENLISDFNDNKIDTHFNEKSFNEIKVFFNPKYKNEENRTLRIVIGQLK